MNLPRGLTPLSRKANAMSVGVADRTVKHADAAKAHRAAAAAERSVGNVDGADQHAAMAATHERGAMGEAPAVSARAIGPARPAPMSGRRGPAMPPSALTEH